MRRHNPSPFTGLESPIDPKDGIRVAKHFLRLIDGPAVIGGGLAMMLYGSSRATKDVDLYSTRLPARVRATRELSFGGCAYEHKGIPVDVLVRDDSQRDLYDHAIAGGTYLSGLPVPTPEHLALIKHAAGRGKDMQDFRFLIVHNLFKPLRAARYLKEIYEGRSGERFAEEFLHDVEVERLMAKVERQK